MNLVTRSVQNGGKLAPLVIEKGLTAGTGLMNPSIYVDHDGDILVNLRHVNYTLYHSENTQKFPSRWGPLSYLHPEKDQRLVTTNYLCRLNKNLEMINYTKVDTANFDVAPMWEFVGEEDCRVVRWDEDLYLIGVRRDTTTHGEGRMEYSRIDLDKDSWTATEVNRVRIPAPGDNSSYCEKNWAPIISKPYHFIKWSSPVEVVKADPNKPECKQVSVRQNLTPPVDLRGGSQVIPWGNMYLSISHEVNLFKNYLKQKDGIYRHRLCVWDDQMNLVGLSPEPWTFLDARVEFCAGMALHDGSALISFGFQDNAAFVLQVPGPVMEDMILEALNYDH